jgi:hypothetical protein
VASTPCPNVLERAEGICEEDTMRRDPLLLTQTMRMTTMCLLKDVQALTAADRAHRRERAVPARILICCRS